MSRARTWRSNFGGWKASLGSQQTLTLKRLCRRPVPPYLVPGPKYH
jgi:hypothetical protein